MYTDTWITNLIIFLLFHGPHVVLSKTHWFYFLKDLFLSIFSSFFLLIHLFMISLMSLITSHDLPSTFYKSCHHSQFYTCIFWLLLSCLKPFNFVPVKLIFLLQLNFPCSAFILSSLLSLSRVQPILCSSLTICHTLNWKPSFMLLIGFWHQ